MNERKIVYILIFYSHFFTNTYNINYIGCKLIGILKFFGPCAVGLLAHVMSYFTFLLNGNVCELDHINLSQFPPQILPFNTKESTRRKKGRANNSFYIGGDVT